MLLMTCRVWKLVDNLVKFQKGGSKVIYLEIILYVTVTSTDNYVICKLTKSGYSAM